ncbi:glycosyltransferase family 2 protein [Sporomusa aerivorans]|uniref:glycosyltransferase n=1 Tax=Sporomusa aerivorans TaxID=204936 RepID=UPI003529D4DD
MFISYSVSVIIVSLALYGLWYLTKDIWNWFTTLKFMRLPDASFVILVRNLEYEVEDLLRYLVNEMSEGEHEYDAVVVDCGSDDLTPIILKRLAAEMPLLTVVHGSNSMRPVEDAIPLCRGEVVHVLDLTRRLRGDQFMAVVSSLLKQNQREVAMRGKMEE